MQQIVRVIELIGVIIIIVFGFFTGKTFSDNKRLNEDQDNETFNKKERDKWNNNSSRDKFVWMRARFKNK